MRERKQASIAVPEVRVRVLARYAKTRAAERGVPFDPDLSDLLPPPTHCPVLGVPIDYRTGVGKQPFGPSIDCIDPAGGYVKGNRLVVSARANTIKNNASPDQIRKVADFYARLTAPKSGGGS